MRQTFWKLPVQLGGRYTPALGPTTRVPRKAAHFRWGLSKGFRAWECGGAPPGLPGISPETHRRAAENQGSRRGRTGGAEEGLGGVVVACPVQIAASIGGPVPRAAPGRAPQAAHLREHRPHSTLTEACFLLPARPAQVAQLTFAILSTVLAASPASCRVHSGTRAPGLSP